MWIRKVSKTIVHFDHPLSGQELRGASCEGRKPTHALPQSMIEHQPVTGCAMSIGTLSRYKVS